MPLSNSIRMMLVKQGNISEAEIARRVGVSPQNLHNKLKRDNLTESDIRLIAEALDCSVSIVFTLNKTGESFILENDVLTKT